MSNKKIELLPLTEDMLPLMLKWRNVPAVRKNMYTSHEITWEEHLSWFAGLNGDVERRYFVFYLDNEACGIIGFSEINRVQGTATWAFYTKPDSPRGTGSLMEYMALKYAFGELGLVKLRCEVLDFNAAVVRLHQKFGFVLEGTLRAAHFDGSEYYSVIHLGIFAEEWTKQQPSIKAKLRLN